MGVGVNAIVSVSESLRGISACTFKKGLWLRVEQTLNGSQRNRTNSGQLREESDNFLDEV